MRTCDGEARALAAIGRHRWRVCGREAEAVVLVRADGAGETLRVVPGVFDALVADDRARLDGALATATGKGIAWLRRALSEGTVRVCASASAAASAAGQPRTNPAESPLGWLASRRDRSGRPLLSAAEAAAGRRLHAEYERSRLRQRVTASWDPTASAGRDGSRGRPAAGPSDVALDARRRLSQALDAVGPDLAGVLYAVCCEEVGLEEVERRQGWPKRSAKVILQIALRRLCAFYGLSDEATGRERRPGERIGHWGTADYRPSAG